MLFVVAIVVSLFISVLVLAVSAFVAKRHALADLRKLPGQKPSALFGNALQLEGEADGKLIKFVSICKACLSNQIWYKYTLSLNHFIRRPCHGLRTEK